MVVTLDDNHCTTLYTFIRENAMNVLLAVDQSLHSAEAIKAVSERQWPPDTTVHVLSVIESSLSLTTSQPETVEDPAYTHRQMSEEARRLTMRVADSLKANGVEAEALVREGDPRSEILDESRDWPADLIIIGSQSQSSIRQWMLGSVAHSIASQAPCSVEVVRLPTDGEV